MKRRAVLVTGTRKRSAELERTVIAALEQADPDLVIHGYATGADAVAAEWVDSEVVPADVPMPAQWKELGNAAGPTRNGLMVTVSVAGPSRCWPSRDLGAKARGIACDKQKRRG